MDEDVKNVCYVFDELRNVMTGKSAKQFLTNTAERSKLIKFSTLLISIRIILILKLMYTPHCSLTSSPALTRSSVDAFTRWQNNFSISLNHTSYRQPKGSVLLGTYSSQLLYLSHTQCDMSKVANSFTSLLGKIFETRQMKK